MFWATKAERADIKAMGAMARNTNSFSEMPMPAEATRPSLFTMLVMIKKEMWTSSSCKAMGPPTRRMPKGTPGARRFARPTGKEKGCLRK